MKLPLLLEAKPRILEGPSVMIQSGKWRIDAPKVIDTYLDLCVTSPSTMRHPILHDKEIEFEQDSICHLEIFKPGTESFLTVYLHKT